MQIDIPNNSSWWALPTPFNQFIQLVFGSGCNDLNISIGQFFTCPEISIAVLFLCTLPDKNSLHFSFYNYLNSLKHMVTKHTCSRIVCERRKTMLKYGQIIFLKQIVSFSFWPIIADGKYMKTLLSFLLIIFLLLQNAQQGLWQAQLHREDGNNIVFTFEWKTENGKPVWYIHNASEKIKVTDIKTKGDSVNCSICRYLNHNSGCRYMINNVEWNMVKRDFLTNHR